MTTFILIVFATGLVLHGASCSPAGGPDELDELGTVDMVIKDQAFRLWVADSFFEHSRGLMEVSADRMAPLPDGTERGMIFLFDHEQERSFWMLWHNQYPSMQPIRIAIEVNAGVFRRIGLNEGDALAIPSSLLKREP